MVVVEMAREVLVLVLVMKVMMVVVKKHVVSCLHTRRRCGQC